MANPYFIKIELPDTTQTGNAVSGTSSSTESGANGTAGGSTEQTAASVLQTAKKVVAVTGLAATADKLISYNISTVNLRTGASEYEQRLSTVYSGIKQVGMAGLAIATGVATGNLPLALLGLAVAGTQQLINISQKAQTIRTEQSIENISIGMATVRAGVSGRRGANQ